MFTDLRKAGKLAIGIKQASKAASKGLASSVILASDAPDSFVSDILRLCDSKGIECRRDMKRRELGKACGIDCDALAVAVLAVQ